VTRVRSRRALPPWPDEPDWPRPGADPLDQAGRRFAITTSDGLHLAAVQNEPPAGDATESSGTVVFVHGYGLDHHCWRLQRAALADRIPVVAYDHRSHGASERAQQGQHTLEAITDDLAAVVAALPPGPLLLVGHSMGGMAIQLLAARVPELFGVGPARAGSPRVAGVALVSTNVDPVERVDLGLPGAKGRLLALSAGAVVRTAARLSGLVDPIRSADRALALRLTRAWSFAGPASDAQVRFVAAMHAATPIAVAGDFYPEFALYDGRAGLAVLRHVPAVIICGEQDNLTPIARSEAIAAELPDAEFVRLDPSGHLVMIERPVDVTRAIERLAARVGLLPPLEHVEVDVAGCRR
jgi:pimeloyl-ACP methyl ester carboxylesterase